VTDPDASRFHGAIADTEPDGWALRVIRRDHAKRRQAAKARGEEMNAMVTALDFLRAVDDASRVGALRFRDDAGVCQRTQEPGRRTEPPLLELPDLFRATRAVEHHTETLADLEYLRGRGTTLGGLRPKWTGPEASIDALLGTASYFGLSSDRAAAVLGHVERAVSTRRELATELGLTTERIESFADAFEHDARAVAQRRMA